MNNFYTIKETNNGTVEIIPCKDIRLSTKNIAAKLMSISYELVTETPFVVVMRRDEEVTLFPSGKMILKKLDSLDDLKKLVEEIYTTILCKETINI